MAATAALHFAAARDDSEGYDDYDDSDDSDDSYAKAACREDLRQDERELRAVGDRAWSGEDSEGEELYDAGDLDDETGAEYSQPPDEYEEDESELEALKEEAAMPLEDVARRMVEGAEDVYLTHAAAAQALGYEEIDATFCVTASGERVPVGGADLPASMRRTPYSALRAFDTGSARGWGVCCAQDISSGDVVAEMVGRVLSESEFEQVMPTATPPRMFRCFLASFCCIMTRLLTSPPLRSAWQLDDRSYVVSFDDAMLAHKREAGDSVLFIDGTHHSNLSRLVNDDTEAPNLKLVYSPSPVQGPPTEAVAPSRGRGEDEAVAEPPPQELPRRAFLVAAVDVPAWTELTWDYGCHYDRHWLPWWQRRPDPPRARRTAVKSAPIYGMPGSRAMGSRAELDPAPLWPNVAKEKLSHKQRRSDSRLMRPQLATKAARKSAPTCAPAYAWPEADDESDDDEGEAEGEEDVEALIERLAPLDDAEGKDIEEEGEEWAVEVVLSRSNEGEDEDEDEDEHFKISMPPELGLWEAIDLTRSSSVEDRGRGLEHLLCLVHPDNGSPEFRARSAKLLPGARRSVGPPHCMQPVQCVGCQLVRWPEPLFDATRWPRTANRIIRDGMLRGRKAFALPKRGGLEQREICCCDDAGREAARLKRAEPVLARDRAARESATCGADHLLAAMVDAATDAIRAWEQRMEQRMADAAQDGGSATCDEDESDREAFLMALKAANVIFEAGTEPKTAVERIPPSRLHAHCGGVIGLLTKVWGHADRTASSSRQIILEVPNFQISALDFQNRAFIFFQRVFETLPPSLDGLHWVGHACTQLTGESRVYDLLSLVAQQVRQPRADFVAAGGCALLVQRAFSFNLSLPRGSISQQSRYQDILNQVGQCVAMMAILARDSAAAAEALLEAGAPLLVAKLLSINELRDGVQRSEPREALCSETLSALSFRSPAAADAVQRAMEEIEAMKAAKIAEDARRREMMEVARIAEEARRRELERARAEERERELRERAEKHERLRLAREKEAAARKESELRKLPCDRDWPYLTDAHRGSATRLGFTHNTWVRDQWHQVNFLWSELSRQKNACANIDISMAASSSSSEAIPPALVPLTLLDDALSLGFTEATWHGSPANPAPANPAPTKSGAVRCPWPQCNGRTFQQAAYHKDHCKAKHGGLLAPPGKSVPTVSASSASASALGKRPMINSAPLGIRKQPRSGPSSDAAAASSSLAPPPLRLPEHGSTHQGTTAANDALGTAFNTGAASNVKQVEVPVTDEAELLSYEEAMAQGLLE